jgi:polyphosphate kinase
MHQRLRALLFTYLDDNRQAWDLGPDGTWVQREPSGTPRASHERLVKNSWGGERDAASGLGGARNETAPLSKD